MKPIKCQSEDLNKKREHYIGLLKQLDKSNNEIIERIKRIEKYAGQFRTQLNKGRQSREHARKMISRYKQMIKNKNRDDNGSTIK